jgi:hypothetical protein
MTFIVEVEAVGRVHPRQSRTAIPAPPLVSRQRAQAADLYLAGVTPLAGVFPVRDRAGQRLRNALGSLNWQVVGRPTQLLVVSHGNHPEVNQELAELCCNHGSLTWQKIYQIWERSLGLGLQ